MFKILKTASVLLVFGVSFSAHASSTRFGDADSFRSSDHTKTWTPPSTTDTLVGRTSTDVLTHKDLTDPSNTFPASSGGGAMYGGVVWVSAASCEWSTTSSSYASFGAVSACTSPTGGNLIANGQAPATKIPAITFTNLPAGWYHIEGMGNVFNGSGSGNACFFRWYDGTNGAIGENKVGETANVNSPVINGWFHYTGTQSSITFQVQIKNNGGGGPCYIRANSSSGTNDISFTIMVTQYPQ